MRFAVPRLRLASAAALGLFLLFGPDRGLRADAPAAPEDLNRQAFQLAREGERLARAGEEMAAWEKYSAAAEMMEQIAREDPAWNPVLVASRREEYRIRAAALGELAFRLPEGYVRVQPAMTRLGTRPALGRVLADQVRIAGEGKFSVVGYTVELAEVASLLGARCNCPDFVVRGAVEDYACRHIWAVAYSRRLLERTD